MNRISSTPLWQAITIVIVLYMVQGMTLSLCEVIPLYLASFGATWKQQGILSFVMYPFTVKLLWAPFVDVLYIKKLGRRQTWLLPVLFSLGIIFLVLSFYFEQMLRQLRVFQLTIVLFFIILLIATQDICVDGWALSLFSSSNVIWQSISQTIGQPLGSFLGSPILLTFESADMTNRLIRQPLGLPFQTYGLFTLAQFLRFWGIVFLLITIGVIFLFRQQRHLHEENLNNLKLVQTYVYVVKLFRKKAFQKSIWVLLGPNFGYAATAAMSFLVLINNNVIRRETLGLITMPLILIRCTVPLLLSRTHRPLILFAYSYIPRLILCAIIGIFVYYGAQLKQNPILFYSLLIILLIFNDVFVYFQGTARGGFFAHISDKRIGSTYYTLLASINNIGLFISSTVVLHSANWLPKDRAYFYESAICITLGFLWIWSAWTTMHDLQGLPVEEWHVEMISDEPTRSVDQSEPMIFDEDRRKCTIDSHN